MFQTTNQFLFLGSYLDPLPIPPCFEVVPGPCRLWRLRDLPGGHSWTSPQPGPGDSPAPWQITEAKVNLSELNKN